MKIGMRYAQWSPVPWMPCQKLSVVAYGALLDMILRGAIAAGEPVTERLIAARLGM